MAPMLDKEMSKIDWENKTAREIKNLVRGLNPIMGTYSYLDGKKIKFWKVDALPNDNSDFENGTVIKSDSKEGLYIKAKDGIIKVLEIQGENAKRMSVQDFLRGNKIEIGRQFKQKIFYNQKFEIKMNKKIELVHNVFEREVRYGRNNQKSE